MPAAEDIHHKSDPSRSATNRSSSSVSYQIVADVATAVDGAAILLAGCLSHFFYFSLFAAGSWQLTLTASALGAFLTMIVFRRRGLYMPSRLVRWWDVIGKIGATWALIFLSIVTIGFLAKISGTYSRGWALAWFASALLFLFAARVIVYGAIRHPSIAPFLVRRVAIVGSNEQARQLVDHFTDSGEDIEIVGVYTNPFSTPDHHPTLPTQGNLEDLLADIQGKQIFDVILALHHHDDAHIWAVTEMLAELPVSVRLAPDVFDLKSNHLRTEKVGSVNTPVLLSPPFLGWNRIIKGLEDRLMAVAFLIFFAPLFLVVSIAIKLESKGPVFFIQRRHGFNHEIIDVIKFRTMTTLDDGDHIVQATRNDSRITRVGRILRRSSMDELPQLLNVLKGQMSIVGPRPHAIAHNEMYAAMIGSYSKRHIVKPGITGWAQINGYRGETRDPSMMEKRIEYDLHYIENWSLWFDIKIILLTPFRGLIHPNAH
ncbi:undecaprenyl-phosphate glucose phosphotransferase [Parvibaculaceae bacterium PLY_AMNH_Bact1]|nr:undecaprenyl-phosphate glucose phosphotransferase [Parvibaculaceae bacterium PLY_AMNH_Bact1]